MTLNRLLGVLILMASGMATAKGYDFRAMTWNIWHGGREDSESLGPQRVIDVIRDSGADVVAMQETYGSGEIIARGLGFNWVPRGTNVSIFSRFPILEDLSVFHEFKCVGALVELPGKRRVAFYSIWLPYGAEIWEEGTRNPRDLAAMLRACAPSEPDLIAIRDAIHARLSSPKYAGVPIVIAGDFNSMSHLDYAEVAQDQFDGAIVDWPTSHVLLSQGYRDAYREVHPVINRQVDRTWTPRFRRQEQDRIDYLYSRGNIRAVGAKVIERHSIRFPSDHAAVVADFRFLKAAPPSVISMKVGSYNIRHGRGMDDKVDLARTVDVLRRLNADVIGLQEVDLRAARSGGVNQAHELGRALGYHAAFGAFMDLQGGKYGMGLLSKHPIIATRSILLPEGNEPRVALLAMIRLPNERVVAAVNVHFDWVEDDTFRFAQASHLAKELEKLDVPFVVMGDFNDEAPSRTLALFRGIATECRKRGSRLTYSSTKPEREIDYVFVGRPNRWRSGSARVIAERHASDHRPIVADATLLAQD